MFRFYDGNFEYAVKKGNKTMILYLINKLLIMEQISFKEYVELFSTDEIVEQFKLVFNGSRVLTLLEV
jgi:hypothetical protein